MKAYDTMLRHQPDFFIHSGDTIYADGPIAPSRSCKDGEIWRNLVTEEKSKPAETLAEFRGNYKYNLLDQNLRAFNARGPDVRAMGRPRGHQQLVAGGAADREPSTCARNTARRIALAMVARAHRAVPRIHADAAEPSEPAPRVPQARLRPADRRVHARHAQLPRPERRGQANRATAQPTYFLGPTQIAWLKRELQASRATWKVIAADMPISIYVVYDADRNFGSEAISPARQWPAAWAASWRSPTCLSFIKREKHPQHGVADRRCALHALRTGTIHQPAQFQDFDPFWEFVSGPIHAGTFGPASSTRPSARN